MTKQPKQKSAAELELEIIKWNAAHLVGTLVTLTDDFGDKIPTETTSEAWTLGGHTNVIMTGAKSGAYALDRIAPRT